MARSADAAVDGSPAGVFSSAQRKGPPAGQLAWVRHWLPFSVPWCLKCWRSSHPGCNPRPSHPPASVFQHSLRLGCWVATAVFLEQYH